ncbi:sigma-70 family RNA polymerase sigma factor [Echinicola soli]|uniref:Sigma-70 family RNA polymerase sigma factor n=1 Tax=Echinicola soli TaxID=2591634 RepID=A0A514CJ66_9BACT|nr:sigma-70 family RNA polymerase sigma factor [Echinicola soli]QDH79869.1 sigma-70 family RNA polymerase sigma factor [Echinicola soli]
MTKLNPVESNYSRRETSLPKWKLKDATTDDEAKIWADFVDGSDHALKQLYNNYVDKLYNYGTQLTHDREMVKDVVHDLFIYLVQKRDKIKSPQSIKFYLFSSFRRRLYKTLERNNKIAYQESYDRQDGFKLKVDPEMKSIRTNFTMDTKIMLENASKKLPVKQREVIMLHFFEGMSIKEIAEILGYSNPESARNLLYRSLKGLSAMLNKHHEDLLISSMLLSGEFFIS